MGIEQILDNEKSASLINETLNKEEIEKVNKIQERKFLESETMND